LTLVCDLQLFALKNFFTAVKLDEFHGREEVIQANSVHEQSTEWPCMDHVSGGLRLYNLLKSLRIVIQGHFCSMILEMVRRSVDQELQRA
jgi:hypothetical protein